MINNIHQVRKFGMLTHVLLLLISSVVIAQDGLPPVMPMLDMPTLETGEVTEPAENPNPALPEETATESIIPKQPDSQPEQQPEEPALPVETIPQPEINPQESSFPRPGWRPRANARNLPNNPFSGVASVSVASPIAFKQEFENLSRDIRGVLQIGARDAILIGNQVVKQGEGIRLDSSVPARTQLQAGALLTRGGTQNLRDSPTAIFMGLKKNENVARFLVGDTEVSVPLPSPHSKLEGGRYSVTPFYRAGTATLISSNGMFVIASHLVPDPGTYDFLRIRTLWGTYQAKILEKNEELGLALGNIVSFPQIQLIRPSDDVNVNLAQAQILAFNPADADASQRPKLYALQRGQPNPGWLLGAPIFAGKEWLGILAKNGEKLEIQTVDEIKSAFEKFEESHLKKESSKPISLDTLESIIGLVNVHEQQSPPQTDPNEEDNSDGM